MIARRTPRPVDYFKCRGCRMTQRRRNRPRADPCAAILARRGCQRHDAAHVACGRARCDAEGFQIPVRRRD
jgi:hypothetical protein